MCQILGISRAAYYKWLKRRDKELDQEEIRLIQDISEIAGKNHRLFGCRKMAMVLSRNYGKKIGMKKVYRIMARNGLLSVYRRKKSGWKKSTPEVSAENKLNREFECSRPNQKWVTDITEIKVPKTGQKLFLSSILDLYDRSVISWNISPRNDSVLVDETLNRALESSPEACTMFHSDRGFQYTRPIFASRLKSLNIIQSMSRVSRWLNRALESSPEACTMFHSDRGFQYTRPIFASRLKSLNIIQSMSRVSRCIDNGCQEGFQGILKDMLFILHPEIDSAESCIEAVGETINYYMNEYPQERFGGRTAGEVRKEALESEEPVQYPIKPNLQIQKFWEKIEQKKALAKGQPVG